MWFKKALQRTISVLAFGWALGAADASFAIELDVGTAGGNKTVTDIQVGTSGGNRTVLQGYVGTAGGNKLFHNLFAGSSSDYFSGSGSEVVPLGAQSVTIIVNGGGGGGNVGTNYPGNNGGGGGGGAGYAAGTFPVGAGDWGTTLTWLCGAAGAAGNPVGSDGGLSQAYGSLNGVGINVYAYGGTGGNYTNGGAGGGAGGGNIANTSGTTGMNGYSTWYGDIYTGYGVSVPNQGLGGGGGGGGYGYIDYFGAYYSSGQGGSSYGNATGNDGYGGRVQFVWS